MCGIFGYIGKADARKIIINGLQRLEYRGYDSWGIATISAGKIQLFKKAGMLGKISDLQQMPSSPIGIGHTRWATHGGVSEINAHPHFSTDKTFVLAQNGIVENYQELKTKLQKKGYKFISQTDTEVIVRNIEYHLSINKTDLITAVRKAFLELQGRNTIALLDQKMKQIIAIRNGSPLVIGVAKDALFVASDSLSFGNQTNRVILLNDNELIQCSNQEIKIFDVSNGKAINRQPKKLNNQQAEISMDGHSHYMIKEIIEQKFTIREAAQYKEAEFRQLLKAMHQAGTVYTIGAGTAGFAAGQIAYYLRSIALIKAIELKSYEIGSYKNLFKARDLIIVVSQSGETADTIEAVEIAKAKGVKIASIVNMMGSTITRLSDYAFFSRSGPEICVASTKAYTAQLSWGLLLSLTFNNQYRLAQDLIYGLSEKLDKYFSLKLLTKIKKISSELIKEQHFFVLGRDQNYYTALEAALKIKEISYKHFEGFAAGELKHGVIALIEKNTPVFVIISHDEYRAEMLNATAEVKARGAKVIGVANENNNLFDVFIPTVEGGLADSIAKIIPFQLISYYLGVKLGFNPDKPRNLAKSVTVK